MKERKLRFLNIMAGKKRRHSSAGANATPKVTTTTTAEELKAANAIFGNGDGDGNGNEDVEAESTGKIDRVYKCVDRFKKRFYIDERVDPTKSFEDMAGIMDADLPIVPNFDVHDVYNRLEIDEDEEENEKVNSNFFSQLVTKLQEEEDQKWKFANYKLSRKDILFEFKNDNFLPLVSQGDVLIAGKPRVVTQTPCPVRRPEATAEEPQPKRLKQAALKHAPGPAPDEEKLYVLAKELATNKRTILLLNKGEELPEGYVVASIDGDMPQFPDKLADFPAAQLKEAILEVTQSGITNNSNSASVSPSSPVIHRTRMRTRSGPAGPSNTLIVRTPDSSHRLSTSSNKSVAKPKSIVMPPPPPLTISVAGGAPSTQKKPEGTGGRLVYKQRSSNANKVINLINKTAGTTIGRIGDCTVLEAQNNHFSSASSPSPPKLRRAGSTPVITSTTSLSKVNRTGSQSGLPPVMLSQCTITPVDPLADDLNSEIDTPSFSPSYGTGSDSTRKLKIKPTYYCCKICAETYPGDNVYRRHMVLRHGMDVADEDIEEARVNPTVLKSCTRCRILIFGNNVENLKVHQRRCWPSYTLEQMFKEMNVTNVRTPQHACGMCSSVFGARYQLKFHIRDHHKGLYRRCIVDPEFRCSRCLKRFDESKTMMKHCAQCIERYPRSETIVELARTFIFCEFCKRRHGAVPETTSCYLSQEIFRCVLCLSLHKQKSSFYQHLHTYHGLVVDKEPRLTMRCFFCDKMPQERYTTLFQHIVTIHYAPMIERNPTLPMPPPLIRIGAGAPVPPNVRSQTMKTIVQKYPQSPGQTSRASAMATSAVTAMAMPVRNPNPGTFVINPQQQKVNPGMGLTKVTPAASLPRTASSLIRHQHQVQPASSTAVQVQGDGGTFTQMYAVPIGGGKMMLLPLSSVSSGLIRPSTTITPVRNPSLPNGTTVAVVRPNTAAPGIRNSAPTLIRIPTSSMATTANAVTRAPLILQQARSPAPPMELVRISSASNINSNTEKTPVILSTMSMSRNTKSPGPGATPSSTPIQSASSRNSVTFQPVIGGNASGIQVVTVDGRPLPVELFRRNSTGGGQTQTNQQQTVPIIISSVSGAPRLINTAPQHQLVRPIQPRTPSTVRAAPTTSLTVISSPTPIITPTVTPTTTAEAAATPPVIPPQSVAINKPAPSQTEGCQNVSEISIIDLADTEPSDAGANLNENQIVPPPPPTSVRISILPEGTTSTPIIPKK